MGGGLSWENPSWDFLSVYFSGFGILGLIAVLLFLIVVTRKSNFGLILVFIIFLITNGNMLSSLNILVVSLLFASGARTLETSSSLRNASLKYFNPLSPREI